MTNIELQVNRIDIAVLSTPQRGAFEIAFPGAGFVIAVELDKPAVQPIPHAIAFSRRGLGQVASTAMHPGIANPLAAALRPRNVTRQ